MELLGKGEGGVKRWQWCRWYHRGRSIGKLIFDVLHVWVICTLSLFLREINALFLHPYCIHRVLPRSPVHDHLIPPEKGGLRWSSSRPCRGICGTPGGQSHSDSFQLEPTHGADLLEMAGEWNYPVIWEQCWTWWCGQSPWCCQFNHLSIRCTWTKLFY